MTTKAGVGMSHHHNPNLAGHEATEQALKNADVAKPDFVFMFASIGYDQHSLLRAVRGTAGDVPLAGCSNEGTINGDDADESNFSVFQFDCATRGKTLLREQEKLQLLKRFRQSVAPEAPWAGFYTVGEIGPVEEHNNLHLFTAVVLALS